MKTLKVRTSLEASKKNLVASKKNLSQEEVRHIAGVHECYYCSNFFVRKGDF